MNHSTHRTAARYPKHRNDLRIEYAEVCRKAVLSFYMSQAEVYSGKPITGAAIRPIITVSPVNVECLPLWEADRRIRQDRRQLKPDSPDAERVATAPTRSLPGSTGGGVSDLAALKFEVLQKVGDAVGNMSNISALKMRLWQQRSLSHI